MNFDFSKNPLVPIYELKLNKRKLSQFLNIPDATGNVKTIWFLRFACLES